MLPCGTKVVVTSNLYKPRVGGIENSLYYLAMAGRRHGREIMIICSDIGHTKDYQDLKESANGITVIRYKVKRSQSRLVRFVSHLAAGYKCYRDVSEKNSTVVVCRYHLNVILAYLGGLKDIRYVVPGIVRFQNENESSNAGGMRTILAKVMFFWDGWAQNVALRLASKVFVFSENMLEQLKSISFEGQALKVNPGIDGDAFSVNYKRVESLVYRKNHSLPIVLVSVCRLVKAKGLDFAIRSLKHLPENYVYNIYGDGPELESLRALTLSEGLGERVFFNGATADCLSAYHKADVFLLPSIYEPFGQTVLEASACGLPTIAFSSTVVMTATYDILGEDGFYVNALTPNAFAASILRAVESLSRNSEFGVHVREKILNKYNWESLFLTVTGDN